MADYVEWQRKAAGTMKTDSEFRAPHFRALL